MTEPSIKERLLIVDDEPNVVAGLQALLADEWEVKTAMSAREARSVFADFSPDVVLLDMNLPDGDGVDVLHDLKMYSEAVSVIMMSGVGTVDKVVESMKLGAETFLQKPFDYSLLSLTLEQVSRMVATRRELIALRRGDANEQERLPGLSSAVQNLNQLLAQIARAPSPVLIEGDSGTGKGVFARLIHNRSPRARAPFVDLNCAGLSKELLESELFGHERGAFTNAMNTKQGLFEIAADGTLFLDEIGEMDVTVQARLLKAIEDKRFRRVGGIRDLTANFRLVAATNRDLGAEVAANRFRADLYYRLNVVRVRMPPLRERIEDIPLLVDVILRPLSKELGRPAPTVSPRALKKLQSYAWPGNVRELRNVLERAMLTMTGKEIANEDLLLESDTKSLAKTSGGMPTADWDIRALDDVVADYVTAAVTAAGGNVRKAARQLQISPSTLYARMKKPAP
ncbi:MAG: sigma-54-dependent Fis family transcriptional regulator [Acidobacteria bacterium]|nr:sigma-54-dependent Fis family transcriptional regulator [Acidobacteriota bacterium]MBV9070404.1 sigma-54-dependent Fis family transcriptional regulator [Acidobacteriota bacterium]